MRRAHLLRFLLLASAIAIAAPAANATTEAGAHTTVPTLSPEAIEGGKKIYRQFCGQCHALKEARAVGIGSAKKSGTGEDGGPSLDPLKVSYAMCLASVTMLFGGHEKVVRRMTWQQLKDVSRFVQYATRNHRIVAKYSDG